jgi:hypothetical protein|tara:strand:+ start:1312 stop:1674 length:363 start_codon:yes stop_codon:yes gene_type:complete
MPEFFDEETGKRIYHENEDTLEIEKAIVKNLQPKNKSVKSIVHREDGEDAIDTERATDNEGVPVIKEPSKLSLYDVEYKLDGMNVVPVDKNTGKALNEKQVEKLQKQLLDNWNLKDEDEE